VKKDPIITYAKLINELSIIPETLLDTDKVSWLREIQVYSQYGNVSQISLLETAKNCNNF